MGKMRISQGFQDYGSEVSELDAKDFRAKCACVWVRNFRIKEVKNIRTGKMVDNAALVKRG